MSTQSITYLGVEDIIGEKRAHILRIAEQHGVSNVRVFGSVARGEATEESDIDLLVDLPERYSLLNLSSLVRALQEALGRRVEVASAAHLRDELRSRILEEARDL